VGFGITFAPLVPAYVLWAALAVTIVLVALLGFVATWPVGIAVQRRRRARVPFPADPVPEHETVGETHGHEHGPHCGHVAVEHGDHVDYIHGVHRHAAHGGHYDEH